VQLHFKEYGEFGEVVIILHGLFGSSDNWHSISTALSTQYRVFALDQRNHGRSPHDTVMSYAAMAEDVRIFMDSHGIRRASLIGHSMGGKTSMQLALTHPSRIQRLVVVDISPTAYDGLHALILDALMRLDLRTHSSRAELESALEPAIPDLAVRRFLLKNAVREPGGGFNWRMNLEAVHANYSSIQAALDGDRVYTGPTLFVKGELSNYIRPDSMQIIKRLFPAAVVETIPGADHWVHAESPELFLEHVRNFLAKPIDS